MSDNNEIFGQLKQSAAKAFKNAYAPYSQFKVGAALLTSDNQVISGCNVENASYGLTQCAERSAICAAVSQGFKDFETIVIYTEQEKLTPPCGACRQVIAEFFSPEAKVMSFNHQGSSVAWSVAELLPHAFTPKDLQEKD